MRKFERHYPALSVHPTLHGQLEVDWKQEYNDEFRCPYCETGQFTGFFRREKTFYKFGLGCNSCRKVTYLTGKISGVGTRHSPVSNHPTLSGTLNVNWKQEYQGEYDCPRCNQGRLTNYYYREDSTCKLALSCESCGEYTYLNCVVPIHIRSYRFDISCPNPLCTELGHDGQKGWIYKTGDKTDNCKCHFCNISFKPNSIDSSSWVGSQQEDKLLPFCFDDDTWDLRHFYDKPYQRLLNFQTIQPQWYQLQVKRYLHYLLKSRIYSSTSQIRANIVTLRQFGQVFKQQSVEQLADITRQVILAFLEDCKTNKSHTLYSKLSQVREFLEWLGLEAVHLVRRRDFPKLSKNDADWLDEVTRTAIKQHLIKIPAPIARHYLLQEYTAARPVDVCQIAFDCLVEENGKWYIKFYQHKGSRWHRLPTTRDIRRVIEEQQQWIRQTFGSDYSYLFCHFRTIRTGSYPSFPNMKPLPMPPRVDTEDNPMARIIRLLIEQENIHDANGLAPHFTGRITRSSRLQEIRAKHGMEAAQLYADHVSSATTFQHYAPPTREQVAQVDLPFQALLMNPDSKFLPWQSLPESLLKNPKAHELDIEIAPRLVVYGHCALNPKTPCPHNLYPKCYGCSSFRPSTSKLPLYEQQYAGEQKRLQQASSAEAELAYEEAKTTVEAMDKWLPQLRRIANA